MGNTQWCDSTHQRSCTYRVCYGIKRSARGSWFIPTYVGEHLLWSQCGYTYLGSSPHTWGTPVRTCTASGPRGFIPTHVGNTISLKSARQLGAVHPHTRGEHYYRWNVKKNTDGSSPHTWGTRILCPAYALVAVGSSPHTWGTLGGPGSGKTYQRFIPTHVGNTWTPSGPGARTSVHPHTRGEHSQSFRVTETGIGSSPHTWGTHRSAR